MSDNNQTGFKTEGQPAFPVLDTENDNSATSSTDQTNTDQTQSHEGEQSQAGNQDGSAEKTGWEGLPDIATHPRWKEREDDWNKRFNSQEERHVQELAKLREEFLGKGKGNAQNNTQSTSSEIPEWFNGDQEQWDQFNGWNQSLIDKAQENFNQKLKEKSEQEQKAIEDATAYMNEQVSEIENDPKLNPNKLSIDKNKLLKFAYDNECVDTKGRWNYKLAFKTMGAAAVFKAKEALDERRAVAGATTSENRAETKPPAFMTSQDFSKPENRPW